MHRTLTLALLLSAGASARAQEIFVAPSNSSIIRSEEEGNGTDLSHRLMIANRSTVPIVVFGVALIECENVKQSCGGHRVNIVIPAGDRRDVFRVQMKDREKAFRYRWTFSYRADSSDTKALAALREHGIELDRGSPTPPNIDDTTRSSGAVESVTLKKLEAIERAMRASQAEHEHDLPSAEPVAVKFRVSPGSIFASTMAELGKPVLATGACVSPIESAKYERDAKITRTPWRPPVITAFGSTRAPLDLRDSVPKSVDVLVRFVSDTSGLPIPESASVLESPHGRLSVTACSAIMSSRATPARDKDGHAIRAWVQMPVTLKHF